MVKMKGKTKNRVFRQPETFNQVRENLFAAARRVHFIAIRVLETQIAVFAFEMKFGGFIVKRVCAHIAFTRTRWGKA